MGGVEQIKRVLESRVIDFDDPEREFNIDYKVHMLTGDIIQIIGRHERLNRETT